MRVPSHGLNVVDPDLGEHMRMFNQPFDQEDRTGKLSDQCLVEPMGRLILGSGMSFATVVFEPGTVEGIPTGLPESASSFPQLHGGIVSCSAEGFCTC